ncbi:MAG: type II toxin-antitoxin system RelE/ParE family toxin [Thermodesulfovibrionales bacterium]|nr:type II toxin-antitoxin system RelE/ParE family toxin [Thermodesulfovibrionales bacterium]
MWIIDRTEEIAEWIRKLDEDAKEAILKTLLILQEIGPLLGRPYVDTIKESKHKNMKEIRIQNRQRLFCILISFDPDRKAILLVGGDKRGDKRFYQKMIPLADALLDEHIKKWRRQK